MASKRLQLVGMALAGVLVVFTVGYAVQGQDDPTPEQIDEAMTPTTETAGANEPVLKVRLEGTKVAEGKTMKLFAEIHNEGTRDLVVYMPAIEVNVALIPDAKAQNQTAEPPPSSFARMANIKEAKNFVVLAPGDYYGQCCEYAALMPGKAKASVSYENKNDGRKSGLAAWTGKATAATSESFSIVRK